MKTSIGIKLRAKNSNLCHSEEGNARRENPIPFTTVCIGISFITVVITGGFFD